MRKILCTSSCMLASFVLLAMGALAQPSSNPSSYAPWNLLESPYAPGQEGAAASSSIRCSVVFPGDASMYGLDVINPHSPTKMLIANELFSPFRVFEFDQACNPTLTTSTAYSGTTMAGVLIESGDTSRYWVVNPTVPQLEQYERGSGTPTGMMPVPLPNLNGFYGDGVVDSNGAGEQAFVVDIVNDIVVGVDLMTSGFICSFANPDSPNAFGQGIGDVPPGTATNRSRRASRRRCGN